MTEDLRLTQLNSWLKTTLDNAPMKLSIASADASFRRYFRVETEQKFQIVMDAAPEKEDCRPFVKIAEAFDFVGVNVPKIYAQDIQQGFLLLSDFGDTNFLDELNDSTVDQLYADALRALLELQVNDKPADVQLPIYDARLLNQEMRLFSEWFLGKHISLNFDDDLRSNLHKVHEFLIQNALAQDQVWVHRDFHSRNLMVTEVNNPGVIDFQDAVVGPITYDLVSLLRDCYISWPLAKIENWVGHYLTELKQHHICKNISEKTFMKWFDLMGVQRHLKAIGIFARLNYRDGKNTYLNDIPRTLAYVNDVSEKYEELQFLHHLINSRVLPALGRSS